MSSPARTTDRPVQRRRALAPTLRRLAFSLLTLLCSCGAPLPQDQPNILLYIVDTLRADDLGVYGSPVVETPALDRLASEGTTFESAFAQSSWTRPSVASIMTGIYPPGHGATQRVDSLSPRLRLLSEELQSRGYSTACITTNPNTGSFFGFDQGFDDFIELYSRRKAGTIDVAELVTASDAVTARAIEWIDGAEEPFFLMVLAIDPHMPYLPPDEFDRYQDESYGGPIDGTHEAAEDRTLDADDRARLRSLYRGEISFLDDSFGNLDEHLRRRFPGARLITVFTSDHGEEFWEHGTWGHAKSLFDESIRVPLIVRYPGRVAAGARVEELVESVDIMPTLLDLADLSVPGELDGRSLFAGQENDSLAFSSLEIDGRNIVALRDHSWKLIWNLKSNGVRLVDVSARASEKQNVYRQQPKAAARLVEKLDGIVRANAVRFSRIHPNGRPRVDLDDLPEEQRRALEQLGYLDESDPGTRD